MPDLAGTTTAQRVGMCTTGCVQRLGVSQAAFSVTAASALRSGSLWSEQMDFGVPRTRSRPHALLLLFHRTRAAPPQPYTEYAST